MATLEQQDMEVHSPWLDVVHLERMKFQKLLSVQEDNSRSEVAFSLKLYLNGRRRNEVYPSPTYQSFFTMYSQDLFLMSIQYTSYNLCTWLLLVFLIKFTTYQKIKSLNACDLWFMVFLARVSICTENIQNHKENNSSNFETLLKSSCIRHHFAESLTSVQLKRLLLIRQCQCSRAIYIAKNN